MAIELNHVARNQASTSMDQFLREKLDWHIGNIGNIGAGALLFFS